MQDMDMRRESDGYIIGVKGYTIRVINISTVTLYRDFIFQQFIIPLLLEYTHSSTTSCMKLYVHCVRVGTN